MTTQKTINLVVHIEGGLVQAVYTDSQFDIRVAVQDFDTEGADTDELARLPDGTEFLGHIEPVIRNDVHVNEVFSALGCNSLSVESDHDPLQKAYIAAGGSKCHNCGGTSIFSEGPIEADGNTAHCDVVCEYCDANWTDIFVLEKFVNLKVSCLE